MKKIVILVGILLTAAAFSNITAQVTPPGAGDKDLRDTNVKGRSNELERIDREMRRESSKGKTAENAPAQSPEDKLAAKYGEIKTDFEQIQMSQDSIIKAYQSGDKIDYEQIGKFSAEMNKSALRLNSNLFPAPETENAETKNAENVVQQKAEKAEKENKTPKTVRAIIVELDNTVGSFALSAMFQNLRTVDAAVAEKTKIDLEKIIELSALLNTEAQKTATGK